MVMCKLGKHRTINYNQKSILNGKWKVFCATFALLYAENIVAGNALSSNNLRKSISRTCVTSSNIEASLSRSSSRSSVKSVASFNNKFDSVVDKETDQGVSMSIYELSRLLETDIVVAGYFGFRSNCYYTLKIKGKLFGESEEEEEDLYEKFLNYYGINMPRNKNEKSKFKAFMNLGPVERAKHIESAQKSDISAVKEYEKQRQELINYIKYDDIEKIKKMISTNSVKDIINLPDNQTGHTPLWVAANKGNLELISLLSKNGANANAREVADKRPLLISILENESLDDAKKFEILKLLLQYGADPTARPFYGDPSLIAAIEYIKNGEIRYNAAKLLIETNEEVVYQNSLGPNHPYQFAAETGDKKLMELLRDYDADTSRVFSDGEEIIWY